VSDLIPREIRDPGHSARERAREAERLVREAETRQSRAVQEAAAEAARRRHRARGFRSTILSQLVDPGTAAPGLQTTLGS
jgi:hypothetical protein